MHTEGEPHSALPDALVFQEARRWIDESHDDASRPANIEEILKNLLQDTRRCQTARSIKSIMVLTALTQFVKLHTRLRNHPKCRTPVTTASLMASMCMGKGAWFAHKIRVFEAYVRRHHALPPSKHRSANDHLMLLDNETVLQGIREYLAAAKLGEVTPRLFQRHLTNIVFPSLGMSGSSSAISESTCCRWLQKLGYRNLEVQKGLYVDGHERPDVIEARGTFLAKMRGFHRYVCSSFILFHRMNKTQVHANS